MKYIKKSKGSEKKFQIAKTLEIIAFWIQEFIKSAFFGFIVFCVILFTTGDMPTSIFSGLFTAYMFIGNKISQRIKLKICFDFCTYNSYLSLVMIVVAIVALALSSPIMLITWPLLVAGVVLFIAAIIGLFEISLAYYWDYCDYIGD